MNTPITSEHDGFEPAGGRRRLLSSRLGLALYALLPNHWVQACLTPFERAIIAGGDLRHNTERTDYADPTQYQGGTSWDSPSDPRRERQRQLLSAFLDHVQPTAVLEVGPGSGRLTRTIVEHPAVRRYEAVDINGAFLDYLRPRLAQISKPGFTFALTAGTVETLQARAFDAAVLLSSVHHIPDRESLFRSLAARLNRPGYVLAIDPTHYLLRLWKIARKMRRRGYFDAKFGEIQRGVFSTHAMCQLAEYRAIARRTGFQIIRAEFFDHPAKVRCWRTSGIPLGPFWRWTAQEMSIECVARRPPETNGPLNG